MWEGLGSNNNLGSYWLRAGPFRWEQLLSSCETFCCQSDTAPGIEEFLLKLLVLSSLDPLQLLV